jgi:hypothetical protein
MQKFDVLVVYNNVMNRWQDEIHPIDYDLLDDGGVDEPDVQRVWTTKRVIYLLIALLLLAAFLFYELAPVLDALFNPPPPPVIVPGDFA